mgnify:CR=1 FL=1
MPTPHISAEPGAFADVCLLPGDPLRAKHIADTFLDDAVEVTAVDVAPMTAAEIDWYVASGEPLGKAGAYAIQGFASRFVTRIEGSYSNVVGLPVGLVYAMCTRAGILLS